MKQTVTVFGLTLLFLALLDGAVAATLGWAERSGRLGSLVQYFEYGRSVPGKLEKWEATPNAPGNLYNVAWRSDTVATSAERFQAEANTSGITVRSYGMSFVNNIMEQAVEIDPSLISDGHGGPAASPNMTFALFEDDRANRKAGDVVVLGLLSNSVPAMAALSNQTWVFEQPAPFSFPIYWPQGDGLRRIEPLVNSPEALQALSEDPAAKADWYAQLKAEDQFYSPLTFGARWADASPFARLARRSFAISHVAQAKQDIIESGYPYKEVLNLMIKSFADTARADGQIPVVFLIQGRDRTDVDLLAQTQDMLLANQIPYLATAEHFDSKVASNFIPDGHYLPEIDRLLAAEFIALTKTLTQSSDF